MNELPKRKTALNLFNQLGDHLPTLIKYGFIGISAVAIDFLVFTFLLNILGVNENSANGDKFSFIAIANSAGIFIGFLWGFFLQKYWAFNAHGNGWQQFFATSALLLFNVIVTSLAIPFLTGSFSVSLQTAKIIMQITVVGWNYLIYHFFIFKRAGAPQ